MLRHQYKPLQVYNSLMKASPGPRPNPPPGHASPIIVNPGVIKINKDKKKTGKKHSNNSDSDYDGSSYYTSSDDSVGHVRSK